MGRVVRMSVIILSLIYGTALRAATPPSQPDTGPGSSGDINLAVSKRVMGEEGAVVYAFYTKTKREPKPVVIFFHPWGGNQPKAYGNWFDQLARKGYLVIFPQYQDIEKTEVTQSHQRAYDLTKYALEQLKEDEFTQPDLDRVSYIGHLAGAVVAVNLAAEHKDLPQPKLVFALMPGGIAKDEKSPGMPLINLEKINPLVTIVTMSADGAIAATDRAARRILSEATRVPADRKLFIKAISDGHGFPRLAASLASPGSASDLYSSNVLGNPPPKVQNDVPQQVQLKGTKRRKNQGRVGGRSRTSRGAYVSGEQMVIARQVETNRTDSIDYFAYWKTFEMLANIAYSGGEVALLAHDPSFIGMGVWSDGFPVKRLWVEIPMNKIAKE